MATVNIPCLACRAGTAAEEDASSLSCASCGMTLPPPAEAAWWMTRSGSDQYGPYTIAQLGAYIAERRILPSDGVWHNGATVRLNAGQLPAFGAVAPAPAAPAPAPAPAPVATAPAPAPAPAPVPVAPAPAPAVPVQPVAAYYPAPQGGGKAGLHLKRAFNWNLRSLPVEPDEEARLVANGVDEEDARRYLVWRRSVLLVVAIPMLISALLALLGKVTTDMSSLSGLGILLEYLGVAALFVLPLTAWRAAGAWDNHRRSRTILVRGWLVAFITPLVLALIPFGWRVDLSGGDINQVSAANALLGFVGAVQVYVTLMPAVLSLLPGVLRACLRIKALIPESILPGLFLVAATPLYVLLFLVIFTTVNQVVGDFILILGIVCLLGGPMLYLMNARTFTRPLRTEEEIAKIGSIQKAVVTFIGVGLALIAVYAFTHEVIIPGQMSVRRMPLLGFDSGSLIQIWKPGFIQFPIEYVVRSLFTTVLVADIFLLMNLQLWKHSKEFQATPDAASYDRLMSEIEEAGEGPRQPQQPA
jgi:hypothetical protein